MTPAGDVSYRRAATPWATAATVVVGLAWPATALAHSSGQSMGGCAGCHGSGDYAISAASSPATLSPGEQATVTVTIASGGGAVAGMFVDANAGTLSAIGGQGLAEVALGLTHSSPKPMSGGSVSFSFAWDAPDQPGAVRFEVWTLVGNGNGKSSGDLASFERFDFVFGCEPFTYYRDADGDGFGQDGDTMIHCAGAPPDKHSAMGGDCNDSNEDVHPGATEVCNEKDDDCNGTIDDDAIPLDLYLDEDGDGYYGTAEYLMGVMAVGCVPADGLAGYGGDCEPQIAEIHPDAEEVCNLVDDDCDVSVDEQVRPRCGEGWCAREAPTCDPASCEPGEPLPEECNLLDDDCDTIVDEEAPCDPGLACIAGRCVEAPPAPAPAGSSEGDGGCATSERSAPVPPAILLVLALARLVRRSRSAIDRR